MRKKIKKKIKEVTSSHHKTNQLLIGIVAAVAIVALFLLYSSTNRDIAGQAYNAYDCETTYEQCLDMAAKMEVLQQEWREKWGSGYNEGYCGNMMASYEQHCDVQKAQCESYAQQPDQQYGQGVPAGYEAPTQPSYAQPSYP